MTFKLVLFVDQWFEMCYNMVFLKTKYCSPKNELRFSYIRHEIPMQNSHIPHKMGFLNVLFDDYDDSTLSVKLNLF